MANNRTYLFSVMHHVLWSFLIPLGYGIIVGLIAWGSETRDTFINFLNAYFVSFNCVFSSGLILGTASFVYFTQKDVICLIEETFDKHDLKNPEFKESKRRYLSRRRSISFATEFICVAFLIFYFCKFPFSGFPEYALIAVGCAQYGLGVYVGRKLFYFSKMLFSMEQFSTKKDVFANNNLGLISSYVNILSTLTLIFVYVHIKSFYNAPFEYNTILGSLTKHFLLIPGIIATPVLVIFNFYPRNVLRVLYSKSIEIKMKELTKSLKDKDLTVFEQLTYLAEREKMSRDELKYRLQLSLSDIPIGITIMALIFTLIKDGLG